MFFQSFNTIMRFHFSAKKPMRKRGSDDDKNSQESGIGEETAPKKSRTDLGLVHRETTDNESKADLQDKKIDVKKEITTIEEVICNKSLT